MSDSEKESSNQEGRFAYDGLDRAMHEKARLSIMTSLACHPEGLLFVDLKEFCTLTDGNLSRHLQILEEAGLIEVWKSFQKRKPQTLVRLSKEGERRFKAYLEELEKILHDAKLTQQWHKKKTKSMTHKVKEDLSTT